MSDPRRRNPISVFTGKLAGVKQAKPESVTPTEAKLGLPRLPKPVYKDLPELSSAEAQSVDTDGD